MLYQHSVTVTSPQNIVVIVNHLWTTDDKVLVCTHTLFNSDRYQSITKVNVTALKPFHPHHRN